MSYENIRFDVHDSIALLTLNRPRHMNALNPPMIDEIGDAIAAAKDRQDIRVVVVVGAGQAFSAGGDVKSMKEALDRRETAALDAPIRALNRMVEEIRNLPKPVLACVNGFASGAGFSLALACDLRIAAESAQFNQAFVRLGLAPDTAGSYLLPRIVGLAKAAELFLTGDSFDAADAQRFGLVNWVVADAKLEEQTDQLAIRLAAAPTFAIAKIKLLLRHSLDNDFDAQIELERQSQLEIVTQSADFQEGVAAFLEKRPPRFAGK